MAPQETLLNVEASAALLLAIRYLGAANKLLSMQSQQTKKKPEVGPWASPIYFLYFHSIELALKAYLWSVNVNPQRIHTITKLYKQCLNQKLPSGVRDLTGLANVINLLESNSEGVGFRYFDPTSKGSLPELKWTQKEANRLLKTVAQSLRRKGFTRKPKPIVKLVGIFSQTTKRQ
jgi:hypothetical protein